MRSKEDYLNILRKGKISRGAEAVIKHLICYYYSKYIINIKSVVKILEAISK